jgi:hypothetical protein
MYSSWIENILKTSPYKALGMGGALIGNISRKSERKY